MDTPEDIEREQAYFELVDQISKEAIEEFAFDRMRSYYVANPDLAVKVVSIFREAESLSSTSPTAALVLFTTAIELGLKVALLKPVIYGLVHNESVADLISDLSVKHNGFDRFKPLLARVLAEYGGIDFNAFTIEGHKNKITELQNARNGVVHRGDACLARTGGASQGSCDDDHLEVLRLGALGAWAAIRPRRAHTKCLTSRSSRLESASRRSRLSFNVGHLLLEL